MKKSFVCVLLCVALLLPCAFVACTREAHPFSSVSFTYGEVAMIGEGGGTVPRAMTEEELTRAGAFKLVKTVDELLDFLKARLNLH